MVQDVRRAWTLETLLASVDTRPDVKRLVADFVPPPRFADKSFENYYPRHASQSAAAGRLLELSREISDPPSRGWSFLRRSFRKASSGIYLDGGFGVGKTHLLAALWQLAPTPRAYLSFDELMYLIGMVGTSAAAEAFAGYRLIAVDEWELDDPGNLKMAIAFLRAVVSARTYVAVTSNTLPLELGSGRFSQKDFKAEVEELASAFEVVRVGGEDYRHRHFEAQPGEDYFVEISDLDRYEAISDPNTLRTDFSDLLEALSIVHPIRYRDMARRIGGLLVDGFHRIDRLPDALRWVHFVDSIYDSGVPLRASGFVPLSEAFPADALAGPYGKKLSRCISRLEELLGEGRDSE